MFKYAIILVYHSHMSSLGLEIVVMLIQEHLTSKVILLVLNL